MSILTIEKPVHIASGLTWYNAAVHYTFMHSLMILMIVSVIRMMRAKHWYSRFGFLLLTTFLAVASGGSNYATCLMGLLLLVGVSVLLSLIYRKKALFCVIPVIAHAVSFYINVSAPGNEERASNYVGWGLSPAASVWQSFKAAFEYMDEWTNLFVWLFIILLIPVFWEGLKEVSFSFRLPGVVAFLSFCFMATGFTSSFYSLGGSGLARLQNVIAMTYYILLILNEGYFIGWLQRRISVSLSLNFGTLILITALMFCNIATTSAFRFTTHLAVFFYKSFEAEMYYQEYLNRMRELEAGVGQDVVLSPRDYTPKMFFVDDITEDPDHWSNRQVAEYFGNRSVRLERRQE